MSREYASVAPARTRREPSPTRGHGSRVAVRPAATDAAQPVGPTRTKALLCLAVIALLTVVLLLRVGVIHASAVVPWAGAGDSSRSRHTASPAKQAIDQRLVLTPRTLAQSATVAGVRVNLTAAPLLPGPNHFALRLSERGRPLAGARVILVAHMIGMAMRPVTLSMNEVGHGRYAATGPLAMFGRWQVTMQIARPGAAPLTRRFTVAIELPQGLLTAPAAQGAANH